MQGGVANKGRSLQVATYRISFTVVFPSISAATAAASAIASNGGATFAQTLISTLSNANPAVWSGATVTGVSHGGVGGAGGFVTVTLSVSTTTTTASTASSDGGISVSALVGIIVGVVVAVLLIGAVIALSFGGCCPCTGGQGRAVAVKLRVAEPPQSVAQDDISPQLTTSPIYVRGKSVIV